MLAHQQVTHHVTTIFDPDVLQKYAVMVPDAPNRVLAVFEQNSLSEIRLREESLQQNQSNIDLQKYAIDMQAVDNKRRDWMAFSIIIAGMLTSAVFAALGKEWLSGATLAAIISYAVVGYLQKEKIQTK